MLCNAFTASRQWDRMTSLLGFMLGIKLEGTSVENSMKQLAKRAGDFFWATKKIHSASKNRDKVAQRAS